MGLTVEEVRQRLYNAAKLRMPRFSRETLPRIRIEELEDYLLNLAYHRGDLEEARLYMHDTLQSLQGKWDDIDTSSLPSRATQEDIRLAKRSTDRVSHDVIQECRHLISRLSDQIERIEQDEKTASRTYTLISGS